MSFDNIQEVGRPVSIKDEGVVIANNIASIDFVGGGVSGSAVGSDVTETIAGESGGVETLTGEVNGINKIFTVAHIPVYLTVSGQIMYENNGYTLAALTITMDDAPDTGAILRNHY